LLARHERLSFSRLKELLKETDGSLGAQMPGSRMRATAKGRRALSLHLDGLQRLIEQARRSRG
jgi:hypothetical protein